MPGLTTSAVEVTHVSQNGLWLLLDDEELLLTYDQFPWFRKAKVVDVTGWIGGYNFQWV